MYHIKATTLEHCVDVSLNMREADVREVFASSGTNPLTTLLRARRLSQEHCYTVFLEDTPVGIFGVSRLNENIGVPWLLGTDELTSDKIEFYKKSKELLSTFMDDFKVLINYVDQRNTKSIKWLQALGFTLGNLVENFGYTKEPFYEFVKVQYV